MKKKVIIICLISFVTIITLIYFSVDTSIDNKIMEFKISKKEKIHSKKEIIKKRIFNKNKLKKVSVYQHNYGNIFKWVYRNGEIYTLDDVTQTINIIDIITWDLKKVIGGKGGAPWENESISNFEISDDGKYVLIADNQKMSVNKRKILSKNNELYFKNENTFWDASYLGENNFIFLTDQNNGIGGDFKFSTINILNKKEIFSVDFREELKIDSETNHLNIAYEGFFIKNNNNDVIYLCSKAGLFIKFDKKGKIDYVSKTIDSSPPPKVTTKKYGNATIYVKNPDVSINYSASLDSNHLYILSLVRFKKSKNLVVDLYEIKNGNYIKSFEIPNFEKQLPVEILKIDKKQFLVLYEDMKIIKYEI